MPFSLRDSPVVKSASFYVLCTMPTSTTGHEFEFSRKFAVAQPWSTHSVGWSSHLVSTAKQRYHRVRANFFDTANFADPPLFRHQNKSLVRFFFLLANLRKQSPRCVPRTAASLFSKLSAQCAGKVTGRRNFKKT